MANQELLGWISEQMKKGVSKEQIKSALLQNGWQEKDIEEAFIILERPQDSLSGAGLPAQGVATLKKLPSVFALFSQACSLFVKRFGTFSGILAIPALVYIVLIIGSLGILKTSFFQSAGSVVLVALIVIMLGVIIIISAWGYGALVFATENGVLFNEAYRRAYSRIGSLVWVLFLVWFLTIGGLGFFIIPGTIFSVWFILSVYVLLLEGDRGVHTLWKSREYVRGIWWAVCWRIFMPMFLLGVIAFLIQIILAVVVGKDSLVASGGNFIVSLISFSLSIIYFSNLYREIRARKGIVEPRIGGGRKAGIFIMASIGWIFIIILPFLLLGGMLFALMFSRKSNIPPESVSPRSTYGFPSLKNNTNQGTSKFPTQEDGTRQLDLSDLRLDLETYYDTHNKYPNSLQELLSNVPTDPITHASYIYKVNQGGNGYELCALLDTGEQKCVRPPSQ